MMNPEQISKKKQEIAARMNKTPESPRSKQIRETNERVKNENVKMVYKSRHEGKNKTSLKRRQEIMSMFSKDR